MINWQHVFAGWYRPVGAIGLLCLLFGVLLLAGCGETPATPPSGQTSAPMTAQPAASTQSSTPTPVALRVIDQLAAHLKTQTGIAGMECRITDKTSMTFRGILEMVGAERYLEVKCGDESFHVYEFDVASPSARAKETMQKATEEGKFSESRAFVNNGFVFGHSFSLKNRPILEKLIPAFMSFKPNGAAPTALEKAEPNKRGLYFQPTRVDALIEHLKRGGFGDARHTEMSAKSSFGEWRHHIEIGSFTFTPFEFYPDGLTASDAAKLAQAREKGTYPSGMEGYDLKAAVFANFLFIYDPKSENLAMIEKVLEVCKTFSAP